eukprot:g16362.t1
MSSRHGRSAAMHDPAAMDFYGVMGLPPLCDDVNAIRKAYTTLSKDRHPDKPSGSKEQFQQLKDAYDCLVDADKKALYDSMFARRLRTEAEQKEKVSREEQTAGSSRGVGASAQEKKRRRDFEKPEDASQGSYRRGRPGDYFYGFNAATLGGKIKKTLNRQTPTEVKPNSEHDPRVIFMGKAPGRQTHSPLKGTLAAKKKVIALDTDSDKEVRCSYRGGGCPAWGINRLLPEATATGTVTELPKSARIKQGRNLIQASAADEEVVDLDQEEEFDVLLEKLQEVEKIKRSEQEILAQREKEEKALKVMSGPSANMEKTMAMEAKAGGMISPNMMPMMPNGMANPMMASMNMMGTTSAASGNAATSPDDGGGPPGGGTKAAASASPTAVPADHWSICPDEEVHQPQQVQGAQEQVAVSPDEEVQTQQGAQEQVAVSPDEAEALEIHLAQQAAQEVAASYSKFKQQPAGLELWPRWSEFESESDSALPPEFLLRTLEAGAPVALVK